MSSFNGIKMTLILLYDTRLFRGRDTISAIFNKGRDTLSSVFSDRTLKNICKISFNN